MILGRRSLLGIATMRRSETTEDSQQCMYNDGALIMSSLPMPMHSIKQVIAEEEAAEEQDDRTTNKESKGLINGGGAQRKNTPSGNQSSSNNNNNTNNGGKVSSNELQSEKDASNTMRR